MVRSLWVAALRVSAATAAKIVMTHQIEITEVTDTILCVSGLQYVWDDDDERGQRAIVSLYFVD